MSDGQSHGKKIEAAVAGEDAVVAEEAQATFARATDDFYKQRIPLLDKHAEAVQSYGAAVFESAELKAKVEAAQHRLGVLIEDLTRAQDRVGLRRREVEDAMGNLLDHQDKRPRQVEPAS